MDLKRFLNSDAFPYIAGGVAFFTIYFIVLVIINSNKKKKQIEKIKARLGNAEITEEQKRFLTFGSIIFRYRFEEILEMIPENRIETHKYGLNMQWGISNDISAKATISSLIKLNKSNELDGILGFETKEIIEIKENVAKALEIDISEVQNVKSTYAWDVVRAVTLSKWCFWCGYITAEEMWNFMEKAVKKAEEKGESWQEYNISFLLGRTIHGFELEDVQHIAYGLLNKEKVGSEENPYKKYNFK